MPECCRIGGRFFALGDHAFGGLLMLRRKLPTFEDRLARLRESEGTAEPRQATEPATGATPPADPEPRAKPVLPAARIVFAVGLGLIATGALMLPRDQIDLPPALAAILPGTDPAAPDTASAEVATPDPASVDAISGVTPVAAMVPPLAAAAPPGLFERVMAMMTGAPAEAAPTSTLPVDFLPPAPPGWVRVTEADIAAGRADSLLDSAWAALPQAQPVTLNKGHPVLQQMLAASAPSTDLARVRMQALYMAGSGEYLVVTLKFRPQRAAFGVPGDDKAWRQTLRAEVEREAATGEVVEPLTLGGVALFNRTRPAGKSRLTQPVGKDLDVPNGLKLTAALSHRAEVQLNGHATPAAAGTLIAAFNRNGLAALPES